MQALNPMISYVFPLILGFFLGVLDELPRDPEAYEPVTSDHVTLWLSKEYLFPGLLDRIRDYVSAVEKGSIAR